MDAIKEEVDIVKIFLLIEDEEIERAVDKVYCIKTYKPKDIWRITKFEGM